MGDFEMTYGCIILKYSADTINFREQGIFINVWGEQFVMLSIKGLA